MRHYGNTEKEYKDAAAISISLAEMCRNLGLIPAGGNFMTLKRKIQLYSIDVSHFLGQAHNRGKILTDQPISTQAIKLRLIQSRGHKCQRCNNTDWLDEPITLELEHIDGNNTNQEELNLLLLCPNCHSKTLTWRRAKSSFSPNLDKICPKCKGVKQVRSNLCSNCFKGGNSEKAKVESINPQKESSSNTKLCPVCNVNEMHKSSKKCGGCSHRTQERISWPAVEDLVAELKDSNYSAVARGLGVSDNAVRARVRRHGYDPKSLTLI